VDLYKELRLDPIRKEPTVWVRRLVIYERILPEPLLIREVKLQKGLNIIWAEEPEDENASAEINGHSAGKTTFCRFMRYVLGEKTYGTKANMDLIRKSLPHAYIAAELFIRQRQWAVMRPIGTGHNSYILPDATIEELLKSRGQIAHHNDYQQKIGLDALLNDFETGAIVRTGQAIEWGHILAWCARDQESRFQNIYDWRSPRSESGYPAFRSSKADPLFVMRATLGLFLPDELKGEEKLGELLKEQKDLEKELEEHKQESQFRINLYDREVRRRLQRILANEPTIDTAPFHSENLFFPGLDKLTDMAREEIGKKVTDLEKNQQEAQELVDDLGAQIGDLEKTLRQFERYFQIGTAEINELEVGIHRRKEVDNYVEEHRDEICRLGDVLYSECTHVKERQCVRQFAQLQDTRVMQQIQSEKAQKQEKLNDQRDKILKEIKALGEGRDAAKRKREAIQADIRANRENLRDLDRAFQELKSWSEKADTQNAYPRLVECPKKHENTTGNIETLEKDLGKLLTDHDSNRKLLASIFSGSVRSVLQSGTYDGRVNFNNRELAFLITHGPAMSGEAVETLSVLLADVASLVFTTVSEKSHFPGFLLHDSPREADLGGRIYRSFIRFIASLQESCGGAANCSFQYILTTTTAPPKELQAEETVKMKLDASKTNGLFLRRNLGLGEESKQATLF